MGLIGLGGGGAVEGSAAKGVVDGALGGGDGARSDFAEVGAFGEVVAEEAVGVLHGAFLPGGVGVGVVEGGVEDAFEGGLVEELASIIGGHGVDCAQGAFGGEAAEGAVDGALADGA